MKHRGNNSEKPITETTEEMGHHAMMHAIDAAIPGVGAVLTAIGFMKDRRKPSAANTAAIRKKHRNQQKAKGF